MKPKEGKNKQKYRMNKHKNKIRLIKIVALAMIVFFNGGIYGNMVMAQDPTTEDLGPEPTMEDIEAEENGNTSEEGEDNTGSLPSDPKECKEAIKKDEINFDEYGLSECKNIKTKRKICLSNAENEKESAIVACESAFETGKNSCKTNYGDPGQSLERWNICMAEYELEKEQCLAKTKQEAEEKKQKCETDHQQCMDKIDLVADSVCFDFEPYINEFAEEIGAGESAKECMKKNAESALKDCKTNDLERMNTCVDEAKQKKDDTITKCYDTSTEGINECNTEREEFENELCGDLPEDEQNACLNRNYDTIFFIYNNCLNKTESAKESCINTAETAYKNDVDFCKDEDQIEINAKQCFDENKDKVKGDCLEKEAEEKCGNGVIDEGEECDDGEGQGDDVDRYLNPDAPERQKQFDSCFKCEYVDVPYEFNVTKYLKIPEGQTYLEKSEQTESGVNIKRGVIYFIITGIEFATKIISAFALLFIIAGGIVLMVSSGNSSLQQKGKRLILYSILGLVIAFLSLIIVTTVQSIFYTT